jgi:hypothetical protein
MDIRTETIEVNRPRFRILNSPFPQNVRFHRQLDCLILPAVKLIAREIMHQKESDIYTHSGCKETWSQAFSRTMFSDCQARRNRDRNFPPKDIWPRLVEFWDSFSRDLKMDDSFFFRRRDKSSEDEELLKYVRMLSDDWEQSCALFFDSEGRLGKAVCNIEKGIGMQVSDEICVFLGAQVPHLIRRNENGNYAIISECYVHGIMDGELMEELKDDDLEDIVLELVSWRGLIPFES